MARRWKLEKLEWALILAIGLAVFSCATVDHTPRDPRRYDTRFIECKWPAVKVCDGHIENRHTRCHCANIRRY